MSEFQLSPENRLNMTNYEEWFFQIGNFLTAKNVLNQITEIFKKLEENNTNLSNLEKLRIIYLSFPNELKYQLRPKGNENVDNFIQQTYDVINFQMYLKHNIKYKDSNIKQNSQSNDYMDIDLAYKTNGDSRGRRSSMHQELHNHENRKYCHVCNMDDHDTKDCNYYLLNKKRKEIVINLKTVKLIKIQNIKIEGLENTNKYLTSKRTKNLEKNLPLMS